MAGALAVESVAELRPGQRAGLARLRGPRPGHPFHQIHRRPTSACTSPTSAPRRSAGRLRGDRPRLRHRRRLRDAHRRGARLRAAREDAHDRDLEVRRARRDRPDPLDHPYYLLPGGEGDGPLRAYRLLAEVMADADKVAIGQFVLRTKEYLVAVRARGDLLALTTMLFRRRSVPPTSSTSRRASAPARPRSTARSRSSRRSGPTSTTRVQRPLPQPAAQDRQGQGGRRDDRGAAGAQGSRPPPDIMEALKASLDKVRAG